MGRRKHQHRRTGGSGRSALVALLVLALLLGLPAAACRVATGPSHSRPYRADPRAAAPPRPEYGLHVGPHIGPGGLQLGPRIGWGIDL